MPTKRGLARCYNMGDCPRCGLYLSPLFGGHCPDCEMQTIGNDEICPECGAELPAPIAEDRGGGYSELITYCPCGAVYTSGGV